MADNRAAGISRRNFVIGGALIGAAGVAYARQPRTMQPRIPKGRIDAMLPARIGGWTFESSSGLVVPPPDATSDRLYDEIVTRVYTSPNLMPMMLLIAYSNLQDGMLQVHRPETCYPVGGYTLSDSRIIDVPLAPNVNVPCRFFSAEGTGRSEQVLYWTRIGRLIPGRWIEQRWAVVDANLRGEIPDGILVRVSALANDANQALPVLKQFASAMTQGVTPSARRLLIGS
ncbi:MAG: exosortase-associated protein EpsI, V-type [Sphingomonadaceae bacterium]